MIPIIIIYFIFQKQFIEGIAMTAENRMEIKNGKQDERITETENRDG